jgi:hypothetical protein
MLGEGLEPRLDARAMLGRLKLLGIEAPGKDAGEGLEERVHGGVERLLWSAVPHPRLPIEAERQDNKQRCMSHRAWSCVHG